MFWISMRGTQGGAFTNDPRDSALYLSFDGARLPTPTDKVARTEWTRQVLAAANTSKTLVFFVHGYDNSEADVWTRHTELEKRLKAQGFDCLVVSFDWPSGQVPTAYLDDLTKAKTTAMSLVQDGIRLFDRVSTPGCDVSVHIVAHSMGALVVQEAFDHADHGSLGASNWAVGQVVLLGGDVSSASLTATSDRSVSLYRHTNRLTNYFSGHDEVLQISNVKRFGLGPRVGRVGLPTDAPANALDVDCTTWYAAHEDDLKQVVPDGVYLCHSWYFYADELMRDVALTLAGKIDRNAFPTRARIGDNDFQLV